MTGGRGRPARPRLPAPAEVAVGVWSLPLPLPDNTIAFVFVYALAHDDGLVLVDSGYASDESWQALVEGLRGFGHRVEDVTHVVLTHTHPDHSGLAGRIRAASGAEVAIPALEAPAAAQRGRPSFLDEIDIELRLCGVTDDFHDQMVGITQQHYDDSLVADRLLHGGDVVAAGGIALEALHTPGHARGHVCLLDTRERRLFSGDLLVPSGELQLAVVSEPDDDPVADLEASLRLVASLPVDVAYPGHRHVVDDVPGLALRMLSDARRAVEETARVAEELGACSAWDVAPRLQSTKPWERTGPVGRRFSVMQALPRLRRAARERGWAVDPGPPERFTTR